MALTYYDKALTLDDDIFDAHKKRSVYRIELKDWRGANRDFEDMFRLQPKSPVTYRLRGFARSHEGNYKGAIDDNPSRKAEDAKGARNHVAEAVDALLDGKEPPVAETKPYG